MGRSAVVGGSGEIAHGLDADLAYRRQDTAHRYYDIRNTNYAIDHLHELPPPNGTDHFIVSGLYPLFSVVPAAIELGGPIKNLYLLTLSFSRENTDELLTLLDAVKIESVALACSHYFAHGKINKHLYDPMRIGLEQRGHRCRAFRTHAKMIVWEYQDKPDTGYTAEGSANLRSNKNIEQYALTNHRGLFEFNREWIESLFEKGKK